MSLVAIGGCANPTSAPALGGGAAQSEAFPGTTGNAFPAEAEGAQAYTVQATPTDLTVAKMTASVNQGQSPRVTDGNVASAWDSGASRTPTVDFELSESATLSSMEIKVNPVGTYDVQVSADGKTWTTALAGQKNSGWNPETKTFGAGASGKFVRLKFNNNGSKVMLFEVGLKGTAGATAPAPAPSTAPSAGTGTLTATASHTNGSYTAARAIDGNTDTEWQSGAVSNPSLTIALPAAGELLDLTIKTNPGASTYDVEVSEDGANYKAVLTGQSNNGWNVETKKLPAGTKGAFVRLKFNNSGKNVMVFESTVKMGAISAPAPSPTTAPTAAPSTAPVVSGHSATHTNGSFAAGRAMDGNNDTEWQSGAVSNPALTLDRGSSTALTSFGIKTNPGFGTYSVEVSDDGVNFKTVLTNQSNSTWGVENKAVPSGTSARFIRLKFANSNKNVMVFEVVPAGGSAGGGTSPTPAPTVAPTTAPPSGGGSTSGTTIFVDTASVMHRAESRILGTNRNHAVNDFPNGAAKLQKLKE
ncbi:MAG: discoidin domain-containing protein, partial [Candidatus Sericytochromatia bacterium]